MSQSGHPPAGADPLAALAGGGEMGDRTRTFDWSATPVGPIAGWPQSLKIAVRIMLSSRYAMWLGWGPEFTFFYNDAYAAMTLGPKHPWALGRSAREVWAEIWTDIGPRAERVIATGEATWDERLLLFLERRGFKEESYHTFSYSPIPGDAGGVGGMLCVVTEDTERTIGERRLRTLRELAVRTTEEARSAEAACQTAAGALADNPHDLPFVLTYLLTDDGKAARLAGSTGLPGGCPAAPLSVDLSVDGGWPFRAVLGSGRAEVVTGLGGRFGRLACGPWPEPPSQAVVVPMAKPGQTLATGFVVAGVSPRLAFTDEYKGFLELLAGHVATAVSNARAHAEERRRAEQLAELDRAKTAFFSNVSHEFRTPLTLMLGPVEDILAKPAGQVLPENRALLEVVSRNGQRLLRLVNTLLDFSRIEAGRVRAVYQPTDLAALTADLASVFRSAVERAGLRLAVDCPPLPQAVFVDREMWEKVVLNLLSNAFKFTFEGEIAVTLRAAGAAAELRVRDTGTGIPADEVPKLFERFHRVRHARGRTHEGSGIGLALVQELVRLHGGSVTVDSAVGRGTTFTVSVPLGSAHLPPDQIGGGGPAAASGGGATPFVEEALRWLPDGHDAPPGRPTGHEPPPAPPRPGEADDRPRVLLADDNADMRQYVARLLAGRFRVVAVPDGEAALAAAREHPPELVLTDVMMPRLDGFGLLRELRADPRTRGLPVIMLSARAGEESRVEGMQAGADDYLVKPFAARELLARVTAHLDMARLRRESERAVRESEGRLRMALTAARMAAWQYDPVADKLIASDNLADLFGLPPGSTVGSSEQGFPLVHPEDVGRHRAAVMGAIEAGTNYVSQFRLIRPDTGEVVWMEEHGHAVVGGDGRTVRAVGVVMDVTARKRAEEGLQRERDRLRVTLASIGDAVIVTDPDGRVTAMNPVAEGLTGWSAADAAGRPLDAVFRIVNETTRQPVENPAAKALREGVVVGLANHTVLIARDGTERPIDDSAAPIRPPGGEVVGCVLVFRDITDRQRAEDEVRQSLRRERQRADELEAVMAAVPAVVWIAHDPECRRITGNRASYELLRLPPAANQSLSAPAVEQPAGFKVMKDGVELRPDQLPVQVAAGGTEVRDFEEEIAFADGTRLHLFGHAIPLRDDAGRVRGAVAAFVDITERKRAEAILRDSEAHFRNIADNAPVKLWVTDPTGFCTYLSRRWYEFTGRPAGGDVGYGWLEAVHPEDVAAARQVFLDATRRQVPFTIDYRVRRHDGEYRWAVDTARPRVVGGAFLGFVGCVFDVHDRKRLEDELRQTAAELSEADRKKDEFLATLAHELRNPLAPIRNGLQVIKLAGADPQAVEKTRAMMERQVGQMAHLIDDLMDLSRISRGQIALKKTRLRLAEAVQDAVDISRPLIEGQGHQLALTLPPEPVYVDADRTRLAQVFGNLLNNAAKYTEPGGRIRVGVDRQGGEVVVSVADNGVGIPTHMLTRVFDMFAQVDRSPERSQGGLGIGLNIVKRLVEMHGGGITAESDGPGAGSRFAVRLPVVPDAPADRPAAPAGPTARPARRRILVADDNRDGAVSLGQMLNLMGNDTRTAFDGAEAVAAAEAFRPDVILMDIGMPKLNGYEACRRIRAEAWGTRVVIVACTGWGQEDDKRKAREAGFDFHMVKPVDPAALLEVLAGLKATGG